MRAHRLARGWLLPAWLAVAVLVGGLVFAAGHRGGGGPAPPPRPLAGLAAVSAARDTSTGHRLVVSLTFDDGYADQLVGAQELLRHKLPGTFYVPSGWVGLPGYLSLAQVREMRAKGLEIGGHTVLHENLPDVDVAEARREVCDDRANWLGWGIPVTSFAYPYDALGPRERRIVRDCGYNSARQLGDLHSVRSPADCADCPYTEQIPPPDPYDVRAPAEFDSGWTLGDLINEVRGAERHGGWLPLTFHHVCDGCSDIGIPPQTLRRFLDWLAPRAAHGTAVLPVDAVVGGSVRAPHRLGAPAAAPPGHDAVRDGSLERWQHGEPACFRPTSYGRNSVTVRRTGSAHGGRFAASLTVRGYHSGAAQLMPLLDLGSCAPAVAPGRRYTLGVWYTATAPTTPVLYYRTARGAWTAWSVGPPTQPATGTWRQLSWRTPPVPDGATAVSFGLRLRSAGTVVTDGYRLVG
jgi:peptidoglycan/xylan/chitin deacetylase (PgdA/CDA1 family)